MRDLRKVAIPKLTLTMESCYSYVKNKVDEFSMYFPHYPDEE
jgi:hypothetical protein